MVLDFCIKAAVFSGYEERLVALSAISQRATILFSFFRKRKQVCKMSAHQSCRMGTKIEILLVYYVINAISRAREMYALREMYVLHLCFFFAEMCGVVQCYGQDLLTVLQITGLYIQKMWGLKIVRSFRKKI